MRQMPLREFASRPIGEEDWMIVPVALVKIHDLRTLFSSLDNVAEDRRPSALGGSDPLVAVFFADHCEFLRRGFSGFPCRLAPNPFKRCPR